MSDQARHSDMHDPADLPPRDAIQALIEAVGPGSKVGAIRSVAGDAYNDAYLVGAGGGRPAHV